MHMLQERRRDSQHCEEHDRSLQHLEYEWPNDAWLRAIWEFEMIRQIDVTGNFNLRKQEMITYGDYLLRYDEINLG